MEYRNVLLNGRAYGTLNRAKVVLNAKPGSRFSLSDAISETLGRDIRFLDMDETLKGHILDFADRVGSIDYVTGVLLYGSVAKNRYNSYSDIDVMILTVKDSWRHFKQIHEIARSVEDKHGDDLFKKGLPYLISPSIFSDDDIKKFRPFWLDLADYGIILYERCNAVGNFIHAMKGIEHWREYINGVEVLRWKR